MVEDIRGLSDFLGEVGADLLAGIEDPLIIFVVEGVHSEFLVRFERLVWW